MRHSSSFFKLFPPPKILFMPHVGLDISDDAIRCIAYDRTIHGNKIAFYGMQELPTGLIDGGDVRDEKKFVEILSSFVRKYKLSYVKVSLPEEKAYLFQTDISSDDPRAVHENIEFKLEENVPLSAKDAVFYIDILPKSVTGGVLKATVSVVPKIYIEKYISILRLSNLTPVAFEVVPKSIARTAIEPTSEETKLILHIMNRKTGIYIVSGMAVHFSSTIVWGSRMDGTKPVSGSLKTDILIKEIGRVNNYWTTRPDTSTSISKIMCVGRDAILLRDSFKGSAVNDIQLDQEIDVWKNVLDINHDIPPISFEESFEYIVAAGLALPL
ncbi:MAG: hypothetical protein WCW03_01125 [Candidatus Paceibacterota bacterium]